MRAVLGETWLDFPVPDHKDLAESIRVTRAFLEKWKGHSRITPAIAPHAPFTNSKESLVAARDLAKEFNAPLLIHLSETRDEQTQIAEKYGGATPTTVARLDRFPRPERSRGPLRVVRRGRPPPAFRAARRPRAQPGIEHEARVRCRAGRGRAQRRHCRRSRDGRRRGLEQRSRHVGGDGFRREAREGLDDGPDGAAREGPPPDGDDRGRARDEDGRPDRLARAGEARGPRGGRSRPRRDSSLFGTSSRRSSTS